MTRNVPITHELRASTEILTPLLLVKAKTSPVVTKSTHPADDVADYMPEVDPVDSIVDDLAQQDTMPSGASEALEGYPEANITAHPGGPERDDAGVENGERVARVPLEDETQISDELVHDGLDEADEELRDLEDDEGEEEEAL